jgi:hypothetical protein
MNKGLIYALDIQKKKNKKNMRLDLAGDPAGQPVLYSPTKVTRARDFAREKEEQEALEEIEKEKRRVIRAKNKEKREEKEAIMQLRRELKAQNPPAPKPSPKKRQLAVSKAKKVPVIMPGPQKALEKSKKAPKSPKKKVPEVVVVDEEEERVVTSRRSKRPIVLPERFRTFH